MQPFAFTDAERQSLDALIQLGLVEDVGAGDVTTECLVPHTLQWVMDIRAREALVMCGGAALAAVFSALDPAVRVEIGAQEGESLEKGACMARISGSARSLLTGERLALNLVQRMCGVATQTAAFVQAVQGTRARILDTRKTIPGFRLLDQYAVRVGGGLNHRVGLYDMVLIKDNHIALCGGVAAAVRQALAQLEARGLQVPIVVECDTLAQVQEALPLPVERILLDNMPPDMLREAVKLSGGQRKLEASGGVNLLTVRAIAETGVDYISVGALTHSVRAADIGADMEPAL